MKTKKVDVHILNGAIFETLSRTIFHTLYKSNTFYVKWDIKKAFQARTCQMCRSYLKTKCDKRKYFIKISATDI